MESGGPGCFRFGARRARRWIRDQDRFRAAALRRPWPLGAPSLLVGHKKTLCQPNRLCEAKRSPGSSEEGMRPSEANSVCKKLEETEIFDLLAAVRRGGWNPEAQGRAQA